MKVIIEEYGISVVMLLVGITVLYGLTQALGMLGG